MEYFFAASVQKLKYELVMRPYSKKPLGASKISGNWKQDQIYG